MKVYNNCITRLRSIFKSLPNRESFIVSELMLTLQKLPSSIH